MAIPFRLPFVYGLEGVRATFEWKCMYYCIIVCAQVPLDCNGTFPSLTSYQKKFFSKKKFEYFLIMYVFSWVTYKPLYCRK